MEGIQAVLFDLDNTIVDRARTFGKFAEELLGAYCSHAPKPERERLHARIMELDEDGYKDKSALFAELLDELPWTTEAPSHGELMTFYGTTYVRGAVLMERARETIAHARSKYRTGMITNGKTAIQYGKIDRLGIRGYFDVIVVSEEAGIKKPDPRIFAFAAEALGLRPEQCLYVGDHPVNDIEGASSFGMATIWLQVNQPWREGLAAKPLHTIRRLDELMALI